MEWETVLTSLCLETVLVTTTFQKKNPKMKNKTSNTECSQQMSVFLFLNRTVSVYSWFADEKTEAHKFKGFDLRPEGDIWNLPVRSCHTSDCSRNARGMSGGQDQSLHKCTCYHRWHLSSIPGTHMVETVNHFLQVIPWSSHICSGTLRHSHNTLIHIHTSVHTHTHASVYKHTHKCSYTHANMCKHTYTSKSTIYF